MVNEKDNADTRQARWARFRFAIIGPLLSAPPEVGGLQAALIELSNKQWRHPINGLPFNISVSTIERWTLFPLPKRKARSVLGSG